MIKNTNLLLSTFVAATCTLASSALLAQTVSFTAGPGATVVEPTIPKVIDQATGRNRVFVNYLRVVDLQGNGRPDILLIPGLPSVEPWVYAPMRLLRPSGVGAFSDVTRQYFGSGALPSTGSVTEVVMGDFNRDGKPDVFVAESGFDAVPYPGAANILLESSANGSYVNLLSTLPAIPGYAISATTADVNGDGILDIYVGNLLSVKPYLLIGKAGGSFDRISSTLPTWLAERSTSERTFTASLLVDVDNDGYPDLVLGRWRGGSVTSESLVLLNDGHGDFSRRPPIILPAGAFGSATETLKIRSIDANGDGYPDLLLVNTGNNFVGGQIQLLINRGDGTFVDESLARLGPRATIPTGMGWYDVNVIDINGDGKLDILALASYHIPGNPPDFAWINDGRGNFAPVAVSTLPTTFVPRIVLADANGDGMPDLIWFNYNTDGNLSYQTFFNRAVRTVPSEPLIVSAAAGDTQATVAFRAPIAGGAAAITGYSATCRFGASVRVASGVASPLTVTGLANGKPYLCSVTATSAAGTSLPSATAQAIPTPNYQGLWWNPSENGWGVNFAHQGNILFGTLYTYDANGAPLWLLMSNGAMQSDGVTFTGDLYRSTGPAFNANPFTPITEGNLTKVGAMTVSFLDVNAGSLTYTVNGVQVNKTIQRLVYGTRAANCLHSTASRVSSTNYQDLWWNAAESGWGVNVTHQDNILFATLFTYDATGKGLWLVMSGGKRQTDGSYQGTLYRSSGPAFNAVPFTPITESNLANVGTMRFQFADGERGTLTYTYAGAPVTKAITRMVFSNPAPDCS